MPSQSGTRRLLLTIALLISPMLSTGTHAHGVTLIVQHALPADSAFHTGFLLPWLQKLENESAGLLRFRLFPASDASKLVSRIEEFEADIVLAQTRAAPGRFPAIEAFEALPVRHSTAGASRAAWEYARMNDLGDKEFDELRLLAVGVSPGGATTEVQLLLMNARSYKALTENLRKVILANSGAEVSAALALSLPELTSGGNSLPPAATDDWIKRATERGVNAKALAQSAREFMAKYDIAK